MLALAEMRGGGNSSQSYSRAWKSRRFPGIKQNFKERPIFLEDLGHRQLEDYIDGLETICKTWQGH